MELLVKNLSVKHRHGALAVSDLTFSVGKGRFLTVLGDTESGKTSLLKAIAGLYKYTDGEIYFDQNAADNVKIADRRLCLMHEDGGFFEGRSVRFNLSYPFKIRNLTPDLSSLRFVDENILEKRVRKLTKEERLAVMFERMNLRQDAELFLLDDPFKSLPPEAREKIFLSYLPYILSLQDRGGVLYATSSLFEAEKINQETILLHYGVEQQRGKTESFYLSPNSLTALDYSKAEFTVGLTKPETDEKGVFVTVEGKIYRLERSCFLNEIYIGNDVLYAKTEERVFLFDKNCEQRVYFDEIKGEKENDFN